MATPKCSKCDATTIAHTTRTMDGITGILIFCGNCGAIITWVPSPKSH